MKINIKRPAIKHLKITADTKRCKKVSFGTKEFADAYIAKLQKESKREKKPINSYLCVKCNCWHLTSWEQVDVMKFVKETNEELEEIIKIYNSEYEKDVEMLGKVETILQNTLIENNNLKLENYKLKHKLTKLKTLIHTK